MQNDYSAKLLQEDSWWIQIFIGLINDLMKKMKLLFDPMWLEYFQLL